MTELNPRFVLGSLELTEHPFAVEFGTDLGNPENAVELIDSLLQDGEIVGSSRTSNRTITLPVLIDGADMVALAGAERALFAETEKQTNALLVDSGDGLAAPTVYDTFRAQVRFQRDDDGEVAGFRRYTLTMQALPFGRSATETIVAALTSSASPSTTVISDGTSATGWTSPYGTVGVDAGTLTAAAGAATETYSTGITKNPWRFDHALASSDFSATPYLSADFDVGDPEYHYPLTAPTLFVNGVEAERLTAYSIAGSTRGIRCTWRVDGTAVTSLSFRGTTMGFFPTQGTSPYAPYMRLDNASRSNVPPALTSTGRESIRVVDVGGAARTQASLLIEHATSPLGRAVVYTGGFASPLRQHRTTAGSDTADAATLTGTRTDLAVSLGRPVFQIPAARLPKGGYLLFLRVRSKSGSTTAALSWTAETQVGSTLMGQQAGTSETVTFAAGASGWQLVPVGGMVLPPTDVAEQSEATVKIAIDTTAGLEWDEALLFYMGDDAALTIVDCGTGSVGWGTAYNSLWIESPTLTHPAPRVLLGVDGALESAFHAGEKAQSWGVHQFRPGDAPIFVATTVAANPEVSMRYFKRWPFHAEEDG